MSSNRSNQRPYDPPAAVVPVERGQRPWAENGERPQRPIDPITAHNLQREHLRHRARQLGVESPVVAELVDEFARLEKLKRDGGNGGDGGGQSIVDRIASLELGIKVLLKPPADPHAVELPEAETCRRQHERY